MASHSVDVRTVETAQATIRFMGGVDDNTSDSSSSEDETAHSEKEAGGAVNAGSNVCQVGSSKGSQNEPKFGNSTGSDEEHHIAPSIGSNVSGNDIHALNRTSLGDFDRQNESLQSNDADGDEHQNHYDDNTQLANSKCDETNQSRMDFTGDSEQKLSKMGSNDSGFSTSSRDKRDTSPCHTDCEDTSRFPQLRSDNEVETDHSATQRENYAEQLALMKQQRFNPFDSADLEIQDPFPQLDTIGHRIKGDSPPISSHDDAFDIGFAEDHYSQPEGYIGLSSTEEIQQAILHCKQMVLQTTPESERMKNLVAKLVKLRMKLSEAEERTKVDGPGVKVVVGHQFIARSNRSAKYYCEKCNSVIWGVLQERFKCLECGFNCHDKCMNLITRTCAAMKVKEEPSYILSICPRKGLAAQKYRCADCRCPISFRTGHSEPRLCDYNGLYYCEICHWNDMVPVPARKLHNWDFEPVKVCRASKQFLKLMSSKAVLRIQDINPMLFNFVDELSQVRKLREEILIMKQYFLSCKSALESKLLLQLSDRQHFVENSDMYSEKDLDDTAEDILLAELAKIHASFAQHIKTDCQVCQGKGFICELCEDTEVLFPFDNIAIVCAQCSTVLHRHCFMRKNQNCPKCERISQRLPECENNSLTASQG